MQSRSPQLCPFLLGLGLFTLGFLTLPAEKIEAQTPPPQTNCFTQPQPGLSADQLNTFSAGMAEFQRQFTTSQGLGPLANANNCATCHNQPSCTSGSSQVPSVGGAGPRYRSNFNFGFQSDQGFDPLAEQGGPLYQEHALTGASREQIPDDANVFSLRRITPLFGLGLVEAIPDEQIQALADENDANGDGVSGQVVLNSAGRMQRFGSQNHVDSLRNFVLKALEAEMGITEKEAPSQTPTLMRSFIAFLAPLPRGEINSDVTQGEAIFNRIGCASCHVSSFTTSSGSFTTADDEVVDVTALKNQTLSPYSDFLLHDMGPELDDGVDLGSAGSSEYRTPPLWGLRFRVNSLLHDGRAANEMQAILFHGGEAKAAREQALSLSNQDVQLLKAFLRSL